LLSYYNGVGLFQSAVIFDFLVDLYKLGLKLKLNNTSNRRHHYNSSTSFLNNPQSNTNPNPRDSSNFVSLIDNLLLFDFLVSSSQELNRLNCLLLNLDSIFDFLMNHYKLGLKLKLNKISNRRHHYISSISFLNNP
jgi:hypothetical protein